MMNLKLSMPRRRHAFDLSRWALALAVTSGAMQVMAGQSPQPLAAVAVADAWVRPTVAGQAGTGGFMKLTSREPMTLTGFTSPVASAAELHEMAMDGDVMRMRPVDALPLPPGKTVALEPGGHHLMLMGLSRPLKVGTQVPVRLILKNSSGQVVTQDIKVPVLRRAPGREAAPSAAPVSDHDHAHHHH